MKNRAKFLVERLVLRGPQYRLLVIAALIGLISVVGGAIVHAFDPQFSGEPFGTAVWWSFLRLTDPGYLGDDTGTLERTVSTVLTVLGYVLFLGALIAIMTQWMNARMRELEAGLTPVALRDHIVILGWTNRTSTIVRELALSGGRVKRFLELRGARSLRIAILADDVTMELGLELRDRVGDAWNERQVVLRSGSPLRLEHLSRVDYLRAAAVIIPAADFEAGGAAFADTSTIKTLLNLRTRTRSDSELPLAVVEIFDSRKIEVARRAYGSRVEVLASDAIVGRLLAQNIRHPGLSHVYGETLTHGRGSEIYIRECGDLAGRPAADLRFAFGRAIVLGIVRPLTSGYDVSLNPPRDMVLRDGDRIALLANSYDDTAPAAQPSGFTAASVRAGPPASATGNDPGTRTLTDAGHDRTRRRVLLLGWNHKVPALLRELDSYVDEDFEVDMLSSAPTAEREQALTAFGFAPQRITLRVIEADYATPGVLEHAGAASYDSIVLLGSDRTASGEESDARTILGSLLLQQLLPAHGGPHVIIELLDPGNAALFGNDSGEVLVSPLILSHMLAQVALRRELSAVFDELYGPEGAEIGFTPATAFGLHGREVTFREVTETVAASGRVALGVRRESLRGSLGGVALNPLPEQVYVLTAEDAIVTLS